MTYIYHILKKQRPFDEVFEMEHVEQLKANHKRKLGKLRKRLNNSADPELLPLSANALKRDHYKFEEIEKQIALENARKLGVAPRVCIFYSFTFS